MGGSSDRNRSSVSSYYSTHDYSNVRDGDVERIYSPSIKPDMDPAQTKLPREARDSSGCPNSVPVMICFDNTGSMDRILTALVTDYMRRIAVEVPESVSYDPQLLFSSINDIRASCSTPLQIGQFEADFNQMIVQIKSLYIQGNGGGNGSESYIIPQYFVAHHVEFDSLEKRGKKGILFVIGDDGPTPDLTQHEREVTFGKNDLGIPGRLTKDDVLDMAEKKFHVYQIIVHGYAYSSNVRRRWKSLLKGHALDLKMEEYIPELIKTVLRMYDGKTKTEVLEMIDDSEARDAVAKAMEDHEEIVETQEWLDAAKGIEEF